MVTPTTSAVHLRRWNGFPMTHRQVMAPMTGLEPATQLNHWTFWIYEPHYHCDTLAYGARDGARTRNSLLGRQELYQLSYSCIVGLVPTPAGVEPVGRLNRTSLPTGIPYSKYCRLASVYLYSPVEWRLKPWSLAGHQGVGPC